MNTGAIIAITPQVGKGTIKTIILEFNGRVARVCREYGPLNYRITRRYNITEASRRRVERLAN